MPDIRFTGNTQVPHEETSFDYTMLIFITKIEIKAKMVYEKDNITNVSKR